MTENNNKHKRHEHIYTQSERKKIYQIKKIKLGRDESVPSERHSKREYDERKKKIVEAYMEYPHIVYCPAIKANVAINRNSRRKTKSSAALNRKSTKLALNVPQLIENATLVYDNSKKQNTAGQKSFDNMFVLFCAVKGIGYAKLTIGRYSPDTTDTQAPYCQYCVSHISLHEIKNK